MSELGDSLERMSFVQLALLFGFVTSYVLAIGGLFGPVNRRRSALLALLLAVAFAALTDPWVHGALLVVFVVAGLGLFVLLSWLLARLLGPRPRAAALPQEAPIDDTVYASPPSQPQPPSEGAAAVPELARRARAAR
jgi:branched-subunit amino acid transport protein